MTGWIDFGNQSTYHSGYAECGAWLKGSHNHEAKLQLNGMEYLTDEETAIAKGPYPTLGNVHKP